MASHRSAAEVEASHIAAMGEPLGKLFTVLENELTWLAWRWGEYSALFASKPERLDLLNSSASFFFWIVQETLWFETLLGISRLAGPALTGKNENLSFFRLPLLISDPVLQKEVGAQLVALEEASVFVVPWRNKYLAHRDLAIALGNSKRATLPPADTPDVNKALAAMVRVMNAIELHYYNSTTIYQHAFSSPHGAETLLYVLRDGLRREELRQKKLEETGTYDPIDWNDDLPAV